MRNATSRIRQLLIGILAVLSLSVSSVAACACSHHGTDPEPQKTCHSPAPKKHENHGSLATTPSYNESCICIQPAIKLSAKAEGFKLKKQVSAFSNGLELTRARFYSVGAATDPAYPVAIQATQFASSTSSRGPPVS